METQNCEIYISIMQQLLYDTAQHVPPLDSELEESVLLVKQSTSRTNIDFLTKSLPLLGKSLDLSLASGKPFVTPPEFDRLRNSALPVFLGWLFLGVFDDQGIVHRNVNITMLKHIRQVCYFCYKLELPFEQSTVDSVLTSFIATEQELETLQFPPSVEPVLSFARTLITRVLGKLNTVDIIPRHGPGAVATGEKVGEKSHFSRIYTKLEAKYPFTEYFVLSMNQVADQLDKIQALEVLDKATSKVVLVPKDSRGPRLISCEPLELQWIQQGLQRALYAHVESHPLTTGHVNFRDQTINQRLALLGSKDPTTGISDDTWVTLDMKDASDRVSLKLVERLFSGTPLYEALLASRSDCTQLPDGRLVQLLKFAPMGSAVCFPVEALCFWALGVSVMYTQYYRPRCRSHAKAFERALSGFYVYGDDIVTRSEVCAYLFATFPLFGLRFNEKKCCVSGLFRESCGVDAYDGIDVTPVRMKRLWRHCGRLDANELASWCALSNALWIANYTCTAEYIKGLVECRYGTLPFISKVTARRNAEFATVLVSRSQMTDYRESSLLGFYREYADPYRCNQGLKTRFNTSLQRTEFFGYAVRPKFRKFRVDHWEECLRKLTSGSTGLQTGIYALPRRSCLKRVWGVA